MNTDWGCFYNGSTAASSNVQVGRAFFTALCFGFWGWGTANSAVVTVFRWSPCHPTVVVLYAYKARRGSTNEDLVSKEGTMVKSMRLIWSHGNPEVAHVKSECLTLLDVCV